MIVFFKWYKVGIYPSRKILSYFGRPCECLTGIFLLLTLLISCTNPSTKTTPTTTLNIATAANAQFAIQEIVTLFEKKFGTKVNLIVGSSGKLTAQIKQGAPYDVFISANTKYPERLYQDGYTKNLPTVYATGKLVLWTRFPKIELDPSLLFLKLPSIKKISIANPKNAPYGEEAIRVFNHFGIKEEIQYKLVYGESIAQTTQFIATKNCEVGITAKSIVSSPTLAGKGTWMDIPEDAYEPIQQGVVITKYGVEHHLDTAQSFFDFLFSKEAKQIFEVYGYGVEVD